MSRVRRGLTCHSRSGEVLHELPLAAGGGAQTARKLNTVGRVKNHREAEGLHHRNGANVHDQVVVAERSPSFRKENAGIPCGEDLVGCTLDIPGREKLAFFDIHGQSCPARSKEQIRLPAEKSGNLNHVQDGSSLFYFSHAVDVGKERQPDFLLHLAKNFQSPVNARSAVRIQRGSVRLVVRGLEDDGDPKQSLRLPEEIRYGQGQVFTFNHAGPCDEKKGTFLADRHMTYVQRISHRLDKEICLEL